MELDENADWIAVSAPLDGEGRLKSPPQNDPLQEIVVVSKNCAHPKR